jgi:cysteinyl-tRNA synthetase
VIRLYDARTGRDEVIRPVHPGELRVLASAPPVSEEAHLRQLRFWLLPDLIRRLAERRGLMVTVCEISSQAVEPAAALRDARISLNIHPAEHVAPASEPVTRIIEFVEPGHAGQAPGSTAPARLAPGEPPVFDIGLGGEGEDRQRVADPALTGHVAARTGPVTFGGREVAAPGEGMIRLRDVTGRGLDPLALRLAFLGRRYRDPVDLTWESLQEAGETLLRWQERVAEWARSPSTPMSRRYADAVVAAFGDDLDTPAALRELSHLEADDTELAGTKFETFAAMDRLLGLDLAAGLGTGAAVG